MLKLKNKEDLEVFYLFYDWQAQEEDKLPKTSEASIEFNLRKARLFAEAGLIEEAFDEFNGVRMQAWNEGREDLYNQIMAEMDELEAKLRP